MKHLLLITIILASGIYQASAQKLITRTGKISFFSSTPIENIEAFNNEVAAAIDGKTGEVVFIVPIKSFRFEKALMQEHFNSDYLESDKYPKADFKGVISNLNEINFSKDGNYTAHIKGKLTIHNVTQDIATTGTILIAGNSATARAKFLVKTADYKINIPSLVEKKIAKEIEITVNTVLNQR
ncbi:MAG: YceI family protein [Bacteroidetes bacterium]|nr:YceI family protein [Bacteroidota bacterium]